MDRLRDLGRTMQTQLGPELDRIGRETGVIRRQRKFSGLTLLKTLVFTMMKIPGAVIGDYLATAAKLDLIVTPEAMQKRFSPALVDFLEAALRRAILTVVAARPVETALLARFSSVRIGDSTTIALPERYADRYPGCGGSPGVGEAALKIQMLWDLRTGQMLVMDLGPGRRSDARSVLMEGPVPAGSLTVLDLGYFKLGRFAEIDASRAYWISRWQSGTQAFDARGRPLDLLAYLGRQPAGVPADLPVVLGVRERLGCRLIALRAPQEVAARRRQKAIGRARERGRHPSPEHLAWCDWTVYLTNGPADLLNWKEVVVLYRARWQVELMFKLWKSHGGLDKHSPGRPAHWRMAELLAKLIGVIPRHWLLLVSSWADGRRSLWKAARVIREWVDHLSEALDDLDRLCSVLARMGAAIEAIAKVDRRTKHPSSSQLLENPELLEYMA